MVPVKNHFLDYYNQVFRGYYYRVLIVTIVTLHKKVNWRTVLKAAQLFFKLNRQQQTLKRKYWVHGDLNNRNFFKNTKGELYFIDFENIFYTRKWPLAELFSKCFWFDEEKEIICFNPDILFIYLRGLKNDSEIKKLNLSLHCKFGLLFQCTKEIAQTKIPAKRAIYEELLNTCLNDEDFKEWYTNHITKYPFPIQKKVS